ncbi:hypothetical protein ACS127_17385 [Amphibacillus sp. Q70]|uniref:hypothetical protein n=1 Tax=Amphibacillus sp. Q70 TaxID=3453416 RepID=UPI003F826FA8
MQKQKRQNRLKIFEARFDRIMQLKQKDRKEPAERLMKDMEEVFNIPYSLEPDWLRKNEDVMDLYEKVNMEAL